MRLPLLLSLLTLGACASPLPPHDADQAWIDLWASGAELLMAHKLDGKQTADGRYFQVSPGAHELEARYKFEVSQGGIGSLTEPREVTCYLRVRYDNFVAGQRYRMEARPQLLKAQGWLYGEDRQVLARAQVLRCGTF
ncbi:hypothetical protein [Aquipseudomonas alcaligenes]|uniref:PA0061/PA0062 family lipoprotein n=1 Tax=Aquipseudomonas alcaligenes TaxID=43263 RepID=UPI00374986BB